MSMSNCRDYERSRQFYELLRVHGHVGSAGAEHPGSGGRGRHAAVSCTGALLQLEGSPTTPLIDLLEWKEPRDDDPPYPHLYHLGIARIALLTTNLDADVHTLKEHGVELISEPVLLDPPDASRARALCVSKTRTGPCWSWLRWNNPRLPRSAELTLGQLGLKAHLCRRDWPACCAD